MAKKKTKSKSKKTGKKRSAKKTGKRRSKKRSAKKTVTATAAPKKRRRKKTVRGRVARGSGGATAARGRKGGKRFSTKVQTGRVQAKVSCPAGATLITSSVTRKKKDPKSGKVKKMSYIAGQCVMI